MITFYLSIFLTIEYFKCVYLLVSTGRLKAFENHQVEIE